VLEWAFTVLFTLEYVVRISAKRRRRYVFTFFGLVDLLALPAGLPGSRCSRAGPTW
jgi:voltage-gated potassium channel